MEHGTRSKYTHGCRCAPCVAANTAYGQLQRKRRNKRASLASVSSLPGQSAAHQGQTLATGRVESSVIAELAALNSPAKWPGLAESALAMARILDNIEFSTTHPSAGRQLTAMLTKLHDASAGRVGKLARVASMSRSTSGEGTG
jgi:hypothetical protein